MGYLIMTAAGAILAAWSIRGFRREQRRRLILARLNNWQGWPDVAGYYPGSVVDPRD